MYFKTLITVLLVNLISVLVALPMILRKVPRNRFYGVRTRTTLSDDFIWYEANAYFAKRWCFYSILSALAICLMYACEWPPAVHFMPVGLACLILPAVFPLIGTFRYIRSMALAKKQKETANHHNG